MNKTLLVVDDSEDDIFFLKRALRASNIGYNLQTALDGQQAIDYLQGVGQYGNREIYPLPWVIFLDLKLPYVMGLDVLKWIREQSAFDTLPVIVLTSSPQERDMQESFRLGSTAYLVKPPTREKLAELITGLAAQLGG